MAIRSVLICVLIMITSGTAAAQGEALFGPQIGFYKAHETEHILQMGGVALRLKLSDRLGVEGSINYREDKYVNGYVRVKSWPVMVTGLFYVVPTIYGAIGTGWYNNSIDYNIPAGYYGGPATITSETKQEFGWHFGGGLELPISLDIKLIAEFKYVFLNYDFKNVPGSNGVNSNFTVLTAGLLFAL